MRLSRNGDGQLSTSVGGYTVAMLRFLLPRWSPTVAGLATACVLVCGALANATAADLAARRAGFQRALQVAETAPLSDYAAASRPYADHPLVAYLDYAVLQRQLDRIQASTVAEFVEHNADIPIAGILRNQALFAMVRRKDWAGFRLLYQGSNNATLRCADLLARKTTTPDAAWLDAAMALWLSGHSQPSVCDEVFATLGTAGQLTPKRYLERIDLAAAARELGLMRYLARQLSHPLRQQITRYADFLARPTADATATWPADARSRQIAVIGIVHMARQDPGVAEALLASLQDRLQLDASQRGHVLNQIALWSAASYLPDSARRFAKVPAQAWDERLHEWQVREALARGDEAAALAAIAQMPDAQRADARWRYFSARLRERGGDSAARADYAALAKEATYYGFLAAERIGAPYTLCELELDDDKALRQRIGAKPGFVRAIELHALGRSAWARREWEALRHGLTDAERPVAVAMAQAAGWHDRGPVTLRDGTDLRRYQQRFPLPHRRQIERHAKKYELDPAWIAALIRAESAWAPDAHSHANARGLMQLLPSTAQAEAKKRNLRYPGAEGLFDANDNLRLGIAHLATMLEKHGGQPFLATAAYNAGPTPVARWLAQRPPQDVDLWIETIPYRETREYVARILAFAVIYDWRLHGSAIPMMARARGLMVADKSRRGFNCTMTPTQERS